MIKKLLIVLIALSFIISCSLFGSDDSEGESNTVQTGYEYYFGISIQVALIRLFDDPGDTVTLEDYSYSDDLPSAVVNGTVTETDNGDGTTTVIANLTFSNDSIINTITANYTWNENDEYTGTITINGEVRNIINYFVYIAENLS